jgi:hypothetical protein
MPRLMMRRRGQKRNSGPIWQTRLCHWRGHWAIGKVVRKFFFFEKKKQKTFTN